MSTYCFDLDNTLCKSKSDNYTTSIPFLDRIAKVNSLFDLGHHIIICTARGALSGLDWSALTRNQLNQWNVKYHELWLNKPYADHYIDDKAISDKDFPWESS